MSRIVVVTSGKGGVGKSSVSVNLASALASLKMKVCLVDADFGLKNLDVMMGLENRIVYDLNDAIAGRCSIEQLLVKDKRFPHLSLLPACKSLSFENVSLEHMKRLVENIQDDYDFMIVDSPAGIEKGFDYASGIASSAIVVVNLDIASLRDSDRVIGLLMKKGIHDIQIVFNKVNPEDIINKKAVTMEEAIEILSLPVLGIIYDDHDMIEANNKGVPIFVKEGHLLHACFLNVAKRMLGQDVPYMKKTKKHLLRRIFAS
ncbi:septum site-determining protein MinD [Tannockella kyphosi]|uniref:septum site-determining protein MinD n=1 Tax=Tannockella kyphosi TaxID=2899121 RepID=UPI00201113D4|nr:septum site-determining protein MinD [Tannockella kyphosi]